MTTNKITQSSSCSSAMNMTTVSRERFEAKESFGVQCLAGNDTVELRVSDEVVLSRLALPLTVGPHCLLHMTTHLLPEPPGSLLLLDSVWGTDSGGPLLATGNTSTWTSHDNVEVCSEDTDARVVFDAQIYHHQVEFWERRVRSRRSVNTHLSCGKTSTHQCAQ